MVDDPELEKSDGRAPYGWGLDELTAALAVLDPCNADDLNIVIACMKGAGQRRQLKLKIGRARQICEAWAASRDDDAADFSGIWARSKPRGRGLLTLFNHAIDRGWQAPHDPCCIVNMRIIDSDPTMFLVKIRGCEREIALIANEFTRTKFAAAIMNGAQRMVTLPPREVLNKLMEDAEHIAAPDDATDLGQLRSRLLRFLDESMQEDPTALTRYLPATYYQESSGRSWFRSIDFLDYLRREHIFDYGERDAARAATIFRLLTMIGGGSGVLSMGRSKDDGSPETRRAWYVPINPRANVMEIDAPRIADDVEFDPVSKEARDLDRRRHFAQKREEESRARTERGRADEG